ncbi:MAG TPA: histidine kinase dimerization/phospho-acceptor domain-containing protein [Salinisphaeraceae bacterium]|nr:histidine kinase dimerization/phospho-acceptor domain-containing protein [Salinisphaeraceae bacterium]
MATSVGRQLQHFEDWRALSTINAYRLLIAVGLVGVRFSPLLQPLMQINLPARYAGLSLLYLLCSAVAAGCTVLRRPRLRTQVTLFCALDIVLLAALCFAGSGVGSGLGALLIVPVACAGVLLSLGPTMLLALVAAVALLAQEALREILLHTHAVATFQAVLLGAAFFITALLAQWLASRLRTSQAMVSAHSCMLHSLSELNQRIIESLDTGAVAIDGEHRIHLANSAAVRLLRLDARPARGSALQGASPELARALQTWLRQPGRGINPIEVRGNKLLPTFSLLPALKRGAAGSSILILLEDLQRQNELVQQMKLVSLGHLSASIAHEIRNPLSAINHAAQLLAESEALTSEDRRLLDIIYRDSQRIDQIVENVMGLSRRGEAELPPLQLKPWLEYTMAEYRQQRDDPPELLLDDVAEHQQVHFNPAHLRWVLFNLWQNAEHHARRPDTTLRIILSGHYDEDGAFFLDNTDNGPGLDADAVHHILEPFFTTGDEGIGLGLHVARELCESNGARLLPVTERTSGACFRIMFADPSATAR